MNSNNNKKLVFKTPGRECAHADAGCCPQCFDPMKPSRSKVVRRGENTAMKLAMERAS